MIHILFTAMSSLLIRGSDASPTHHNVTGTCTNLSSQGAYAKLFHMYQSYLNVDVYHSLNLFVN
jgi:hypothetical protein